MNEFIPINYKNRGEVSRNLNSKSGWILIAEMGFSTEIDLYLLRNPKIGGDYVNSNRKMDGRDYSLRIRNQSNDQMWEKAYGLFETRKLGEWDFQINPQCSSCMNYLFPVNRDPKECLIKPIGRTVFIPKSRNSSLYEAFGEQFLWLSKRFYELNEEKCKFPGEEQINDTINYILQDLKSDEVVRRNYKAGIEADVLTGLA